MQNKICEFDVAIIVGGQKLQNNPKNLFFKNKEKILGHRGTQDVMG